MPSFISLLLSDISNFLCSWHSRTEKFRNEQNLYTNFAGWDVGTMHFGRNFLFLINQQTFVYIRIMQYISKYVGNNQMNNCLHWHMSRLCGMISYDAFCFGWAHVSRKRFVTVKCQTLQLRDIYVRCVLLIFIYL